MESKRLRGAIAVLALTTGTLVGCPLPSERITLRNPAGTSARLIFVEDRDIDHGSASLLADVAGNVGSAELLYGPEHRAFLFTQDVGAGLLGGSMLTMPVTASAATAVNVDITPFGSSQRRSLRVYDTGRCSARVGWALGFGGLEDLSFGGSPLSLPISAILANAVDGAILTSANIVGGARTTPIVSNRS